MKHIILETDRLMLREMDFSDVEALASMLQDDRVMYAYNGAFNDRETLLWLQNMGHKTKRLMLGSVDFDERL